MTYIRDLDPQWSDPSLDRPITCVGCGTNATAEDFTIVTNKSNGRISLGLLCPWCGVVNWED